VKFVEATCAWRFYFDTSPWQNHESSYSCIPAAEISTKSRVVVHKNFNEVDRTKKIGR